MRNIVAAYKVTALLTLLILCAGCGAKKTVDNGGRLKVVATTGMITDAVKIIGGDKLEIYGMMGPGVDPHLYRATKTDVDKFHQADIIFYNGLHLEAKLTEVFEHLADEKTTVPVAGDIPDSLLRLPAAFAGHPDPHVWFDLSMWASAVNRVGLTLQSEDPDNAKLYKANTERLLDSIMQTHEWVRQRMQEIPKERRVLVTAHDAFGYFGRAYDIEVRGLQGISTVTEAGLFDVTSMVDMLVERKIRAVFVESSVPRKSIEAVVEGCRAKGHDVIIGGQLFSDAMGEEGTPEGSYLGMVRFNVNTIVDALK